MQRNLLISSSFLLISLLFLILIMAGTVSGNEEAAVHIVYTEKPEGEEPKAFHIRTLASVLGSEESAKDALIYSYSNAAMGFSAKLTPEQVSKISKEPGVLQVMPSRTYQLHSGANNLH